MTRSLAGSIASTVAVLLTLSCLGPLFLPAGGWVAPAVAAVIVAMACGALGRALPHPALSGPLVVLVAGIGLLDAVSARHQAYLGVIPNGSSLTRLHHLMSAGLRDIRLYAPPVTASAGLKLLLTASVFAVAVAVDLCAVGVGRPVLAGIPLLALIAVPASFRPHGLGALHLLLACAGWLGLVAVESRERLTRWGRPLGRSGRTTAPTLIGGAAGSVAGVGLVAALVFPVVLPNLHGGVIHAPSHCCAGGSATVIAPLVTIDNQLHEHGSAQLVHVTTTSAQYLRFTALDYFDGNSFSLVKSDAAPGKVNGPLPAATAGVSDAISQIPVHDQIQVLPALAERYLPLPYSPVNVKISGSWQLSPTLRTVFSTRDTTAGKSFQVDSLVPAPTPAQLEAHTGGYDAAATPRATATSLAMDLKLPSSVPAVVFRDADAVTASAKTAFEKLSDLERWFTDPSNGHFSYTLSPSPTLSQGPAGIATFLRYRQGFCEQFATIFTLMARHLGLPARVAVGFTPGETDPSSPGTYDISTEDAHAWPEVWFTGVGWVRFEPTPRPSLAPFTPGYLAPVTKPAAPASVPTPTSAAVPPPLRRPEVDAIRPSSSAPTQAVASGGRSTGRTVIIGVAAALLLLSLVPALRRLRRSRRRGRAAIIGAAPGASAAESRAGSSAQWAELLDTVWDVGIVLAVNDTTRAIGRRLAALLVPSQSDGSPADNVGVAAGLELPGAVRGGLRSGSRSAPDSVRHRGSDPSGYLPSGSRSPQASAQVSSTAPVAARGTDVAGATDGERAADVLGATDGVGAADVMGAADVVGRDGRRRLGYGGAGHGDDICSSDARRLLAALGRVVQAQEQARYGRPDAARGAVGDAGADLRLVRKAVMSSASRAVRLRAVFLPRSVLRRDHARLGNSRSTVLASESGGPATPRGRLTRQPGRGRRR